MTGPVSVVVELKKKKLGSETQEVIVTNEESFGFKVYFL